MGSASARQSDQPQSRDPVILKRPAPPRRAPHWLDYLLFFVGVPTCIAVIFSLVGTRLTNGMPYLDALLYMILHMFIAWWSVSLGAAVIKFSFRSWQPPVIAICLLGLLVALIPAAFMFQAIGGLYAEIYPVFAANRADLALPSWDFAYLLHFIRYSIPVLPLFLAGVYGYRFVTGVDWFGYGASNAQVHEETSAGTPGAASYNASEKNAATPATASLIKGSKLPPAAVLFAVKAEQHYIQIWSNQGTDLVRYRFKDLAKSLGNCNGAQVHRSWWVNFDQIRSRDQSGRNLELRVGDELIVPVSLAYKKVVLDRLNR